MPYISDYEYEKLRQERILNRFRCPQCGTNDRWEIVVRSSWMTEYHTVKCCECGHFYEVKDYG
jgi:uncharacterized Zn finger protein